MSFSFSCYGHKNITSKHRNTLEFTKDVDIGKKADCIIGVKADYTLKELKELIKDKKKLRISIKVDSVVEEVICEVNHDFDDDREIVVRRSDFSSSRTLGVRADKAAFDLSEEFKERLKDSSNKILVTLGSYIKNGRHSEIIIKNN